jgi:diguanylate cyclase (GGDEF)-like protein
MQDNLHIDTFTLESSVEVEDTLKKVEHLPKKNDVLVHIVSYRHNTVLVQNLKKGLEKLLVNASIVLLPNLDDKLKVELIVYSKDLQKWDETSLSDAILYNLFKENQTKHATLQKYQLQLFERYFTDNLTNLPNMYQLRRDLQADEDYGLVLIKIDNFATINHFYGFVVGDYVLEEVGKYLKKIVEPNKLYRLSGAEYAVVIPENLGFYELKTYLEDLYNTIKNLDIAYQNTKIFVDFTLASSAKKDKTNIFSKVSMALIYAKNNHLPFWIYEQRMSFEDEYARNLKLSTIVRDSVQNDNIKPYFQAIVDNKTDKIVRYEALARLIDENGKILAPSTFLPIAKSIKVYHQITKQMIDKTFQVFEDLEYEFSINLSIEDIMSSEIFHFIIDKLKSSKAASRVTFEILESEAVKDYKKIDRFIGEVNRYGAKIAIDDFGSGYSNFIYLTKMDVDYIKIDGSLIENLDVDDSSLVVIETIVSFAKKMGIKTIAEYVLSSTIMDKIKEIGIDYSQGFYIDKPSIELTT